MKAGEKSPVRFLLDRLLLYNNYKFDLIVMTHCMTLASYKLIFLNIHKLHCLITKRALQVIDTRG